MLGGVEVILIFQNQVDRKAFPASLHLAIQDEIGIQKSRQEMDFAILVREGGIGEALWPENTGRDSWQARSLRAPRALTRYWQTSDRSGCTRTSASCGRLNRESRGVKDGIWVPPIED